MKLKELVLVVTLLILATALTAPQPPVAKEEALPAAASNQPQRETEPQQPSDSVYEGAPDRFRVLNLSTGQVEEMAAADFVRGAVAAEMPALYHPEALKAQAVAAYTYAVRRGAEQKENPDPRLKGADFEIDPQNLQVCLTETEARGFYGEDFDFYWGRVCDAADRAGRYILLYQGQPAATAYHAISAGTTEDAAFVWQGEKLPYLQAVESEGDLLASGYESSLTLTAQELKGKLLEKLPQLVLPREKHNWIVPLQWSPSGYVTQVQVGDQTLTGQELRFLLGLRSSHFQVEQQEGVFTFRVQGYGHGVGLSQNGADYMARQGATFDQILLHYYPGTVLALAAE